MNARAINCTRCGAPLHLTVPNAKTVVCGHCNAQLDLTSPDYAFLQFVQKNALRSPLKVRMRGNHPQAGSIMIAGHIRFSERDYWWDEYLVVNEHGQSIWIQYDDGKFSQYTSRRLRSPLQPEQIGQVVVLPDGRYPVSDRGIATISHIAGELTWSACVGDRMKWIDAGAIGIEWTEREIELFDKGRVSRNEIAQWFAISPSVLDAACYTFDDSGPTSTGSASGIFSLFFDDEDGELTLLGQGLLILMFIFVSIALDSCEDDDDDYNYGRNGSVYYRGSYGGGGYGFGK